ncbi:MAG: hemerythrin domain-containing protein [Candidatus Hermodarchaeota archaeon]
MQPLESLTKEHRLIAKAVSVTEAFRNVIDAGSPIRPQRYWKLVDFWSTYADIVHHGKEEQLLFPAIIEQSELSQYGATIDKLVEEHMYLLGYISDLRRWARPMFTGDRAARERVIRSLDGYLELIAPHIKLEDEELFPAVADLLSKKELNELAKEFKALDARVSPNVHSYYRDIIDNLMKE